MSDIIGVRVARVLNRIVGLPAKGLGRKSMELW